MCTFCEHDAQTVGKFFGYKPCCVNWFINHAEKYGKGDTEHLTEYQKAFHKETEGIGFMPCPAHAKRIIKKGLKPEDMVHNRICSAPFPSQDENSEDEFIEWLKDN